MKKFLFFIVLLAVMALVLIATCPDKATHHEAIKSVMSEVINAEMDNSSIDGSLASIGTVLAINLVDSYLNSNLMVRDRTFYNVGVVSYNGEFRMVSVGVLNHVFTIDKETAREFLKDKLNEALPKSDLFKGNISIF